MERLQRVFLLALAGALGSVRATAYTPAEDGIYAVFETSAGEIVARLFFARVPVMAGNFMRLGEGTGKTLDFADGTVRQEPFYDGLTFHRVAAPFGIVGGAPGGAPEGGPGYTFPSEIFFLNGPDFEQYSFAAPGRLAMLDTSFNANGSQFFITTEAEPLSVAPVLFGKHSVFGEVVEGMDVVRAIADAPREGETPVNPIVIEGLEFVRQGSAAEAFDPHQPTPGALIPEIELMTTEFRYKDATEGEFTYSREPWSFHYFYTSKNLENWRNIGVSGLNTGSATEASVTRPWSEITETGRYFFRGVRSRGIASLSSQLTGRTLQVLSNGEDPIRFLFEEDFKGRYQIYHAPTETIYEGNIAAWRAWLTGSSIQFVIQFATLVVPTEDDTFLVTQPQQIYLYFDALGRPLACFSHFLGTDPIFDEDGELIVGALPAANFPGTWEIFDTVEP